MLLQSKSDLKSWLVKAGDKKKGFSMETRDLVAHSQEKLEKKHADMIVANNLNEPGAGFAVPTNAVTLLTKAGAEKLPLMGKDALADEIFDRLLAMRRERT